MSLDRYSPLTRRLFEDPAHRADSAGAPPGAESVYVDTQGVRLRLNGVGSNGRIERLTFRAFGCPHFLAACEWLCQSLEGKETGALESLKPAEIMQTLSLPVEKTGRILVLEDAAKALHACLAEPSSP